MDEDISTIEPPKLIIFDLFGTLVKADKADGIIRDGLFEVLESNKESKTAIFTDGRPDIVGMVLELSGLKDNFDAIYDSRYCVPKEFYTIKNESFRKHILKRGGGNIKVLEYALDDFSVSNHETVFIGDNFYGRDEMAAKIHNIKFIKVPQFLDKLPAWEIIDSTRRFTDYEKVQGQYCLRELIGRL